MSRSLTPLNRPSQTPATRADAVPRPGAPELTAPALDYTYDGSFEGLLTVLFTIYDRKAAPNSIQPVGAVQGGLFAQPLLVETHEATAARVWDGLLRHMDQEARTRLFHAFLSEQPDRERLIFRYADLAMRAGRDIADNYADDNVRRVAHLSQQMGREKHRMEAFVRFERTADDLYHATIEPDFDVLPLIAPHFTKRYADQRWLIFDRRRGYGLYYDLHGTDIVQFEAAAAAPRRGSGVSATVLDEREPLYRVLWQTYFDHVNIPERRNLKLHRRQLPLRYWKYLSEKQPREMRFEPIRNKRPPGPSGLQQS
ncbi:TIGR03915 family putative DNA repair protein [Hymenobacter sp. BT175]|uniref:TIGR03915 family putative DNA repair protein n=1 Tax=Hymenobacter translucens TaxID=2886507 RepID=UPI001D0E6B10|nr:TIGR03915 family putative DNA repair protein [Hymenobacter translucens]MCC2547776.1 TIGR03915 family putative DNA repair protein [Hymenobacter translucens]